MTKITVLIADDHKLLRQGLKNLLESEPDLQVSGEASNGDDAIGLCQELGPKVVLMDVSMPGMNGIEATKRILSECPGAAVIGLSMHCDQGFVAKMLQAGAKGYLLKDDAFEELAVAIRHVVAGGTYISPKIQKLVVEDYVGILDKTQSSQVDLLTPREREIVVKIAEGLTTKEIAYELGLSVKTIETHRKNLMGKIGANSIADLTKFAIREGLTSINPTSNPL